jgi:hypothetical protein
MRFVNRAAAIAVLALLAAFGAASGAVARALVAPNIASGNFWCNEAESARPSTSQLIVYAAPTDGCGYETASGRPKWPSRDPIGERGGKNLYAFIANNPIVQVDINGLVLFNPGSGPQSSFDPPIDPGHVPEPIPGNPGAEHFPGTPADSDTRPGAREAIDAGQTHLPATIADDLERCGMVCSERNLLSGAGAGEGGLGHGGWGG